MKIKCLLFGHDDPVMKGLRIEKMDKLYEMWKTWDRECLRCGEKLLTNL